MKKTKVKPVSVDRLQLNEGQLDWLPRNPRQWTQTDIDRMAKSLDEDPDFAEERPVLAIPGEGDALVVFAHNLLTKVAKDKGLAQVPCVIYTPEGDEDRQTVIRRAIKDNGSLGSWDTDELANWDAEPWQLEEWGVPEWITGGAGSGTQPTPSASRTGEVDPSTLAATVPFKVDLSAEEFSFVNRVLDEAGNGDVKAGLLSLCGWEGV